MSDFISMLVTNYQRQKSKGELQDRLSVFRTMVSRTLELNAKHSC